MRARAWKGHPRPVMRNHATTRRQIEKDTTMPTPATVAWHNVTASTPGTKKEPPRQILSSVSGWASGDGSSGIVALLGASGSGKTTLLTVLAGRSQATSGELKLNGQPYGTATSASVGFVPQTDRLFGTLTVRETLRLGATLRGSRLSVSAKEPLSDERLDALIVQLGLQAVANTRIGEPGAIGRKRGISGGERKRLSIALELLHSPPLLVLDEPTSGLDATAAVEVLALLQAVSARSGQAVVISIHQPSARELEPSPDPWPLLRPDPRARPSHAPPAQPRRSCRPSRPIAAVTPSSCARQAPSPRSAPSASSRTPAPRSTSARPPERCARARAPNSCLGPRSPRLPAWFRRTPPSARPAGGPLQVDRAAGAAPHLGGGALPRRGDRRVEGQLAARRARLRRRRAEPLPRRRPLGARRRQGRRQGRRRGLGRGSEARPHGAGGRAPVARQPQQPEAPGLLPCDALALHRDGGESGAPRHPPLPAALSPRLPARA